jgi:aminoglycoside phosphotransferase (APT) family kinase protein
VSSTRVGSVRLRLEEVERRATACVQRRLPGAAITDVTELSGGASSLTYVGRLEHAPADRAVIKVAPAGHEPIRNRDVLRQARLLSVLAGIEGVPVPDVYGTDAGDPPGSPPLFVMSHVEGDSFEPITGTDGPGPGPQAVEQRGLAAARALARLHAVECGISELEQERIFTLADEVGRWSRALATCDGDLHPPAIDRVEVLLRASFPAPLRPVITHGDYRLGNMLSTGGRILAVIDWEIWSINDPRVDLGWFLTMSDPSRPDASGRETGMPQPARLAEEYQRAWGAPVPDPAWFAGLARFKEVAVLSLIIKHARRSDTPNERVVSFAARIPRLLELAIESLEHGRAWPW